jgi:transcriptional regulator with XRE-family HTH domain
MPSANRQPNRRLAWQRLQRGWSHEELRKQLIRAMAADGQNDTGLSRNTVRRWETGERAPEPRYRKYLVLIFGMPADELGLLDPDELAMRPEVSDGGVDLLWRFATMFGGNGGEIDRETFLKGLLALGASPLLPSLMSSDDTARDAYPRLSRESGSPGAVSARAVKDYEAITAGHRRLYWSTDPLPLYTSVKSHVTLGDELLNKGGSDDAVRRLSAALSESAMLAGRIAFFDLKRPEPAHADLELALDATEKSGDNALAAAVLAHMSFVAAHTGNRAAAHHLLSAAMAHSVNHTDALTRAWLNCVQAEVTASLGDRADSFAALNRAESLLTEAGRNPQPEWLDWFDASRFAAFAGHANLLLGRAHDARIPLEVSLAELGPEATKQKAVVLADLAASHVDDDLEAACGLTGQALDQLSTSWYATGYERVQAVRRQLTPHQQTRHVRELEDRIRSTVPALRT